MSYRVLLVDGKHALWRSADAYRELWVTTPDGERQPTGAVYGLLNIIARAKTEFLARDGVMIICWEGGNLLRRKWFPKYKRKSEILAPDRLQLIASVSAQQNIVQEMLSGLGVPQAFAPGWEADDVMGTLAFRWSKKEKMKVGIFTGDQDLWQCIGKRVHVLRPQRTGDVEVVDLQKLKEHTGLDPRGFLYAKALAGDRGDNIPGVRGIGEKIATRIVTQCDAKTCSSDIVELAHRALSNVKLSDRMSAELTRSLESNELSLWYKLSRIRRMVDVKFRIHSRWSSEKLRQKLMWLRFRSWMQEDRFRLLRKLGEARV